LQNAELKALFADEEHELYKHLSDLPQDTSSRKVNDMIKRARLLKAHICLLEHIRSSLPFFGKEKFQMSLIQNLAKVYETVAAARGLPIGDFPPVGPTQQKLANIDAKTVPKLENSALVPLDHMLSVEMPKLIAVLPYERRNTTAADVLNVGKASPFAGGTSSAHRFDPEEHRELFEQLQPVNGVLNAQQMKSIMEQSRLSNTTLHRIWTLASRAIPAGIQQDDHCMDLWQFGVAMRLMQMKIDHAELPQTLPRFMIPPRDWRGTPTQATKQKPQLEQATILRNSPAESDGTGGKRNGSGLRQMDFDPFDRAGLTYQ